MTSKLKLRHHEVAAWDRMKARAIANGDGVVASEIADALILAVRAETDVEGEAVKRLQAHADAADAASGAAT